MKLTTICFLLSCSLSTIAQNNWSKDQRNNLYEDYLAALGRYEGLTKDQKESIGLCGLEQTTTKYPRGEYANKIDIEIKRITESTISQCAKNIGVELKLKGQEESPEPIKITEEPQSDEWQKEDKTNLVKESSKYLSGFDHLTEEQRDEISLCYMEKTIAKKSKEEYSNMIAIEINKYLKSTIEQCSKSNDIDLKVPAEDVVVDESIVTKELLVGTWNTDQGFILTFKSDGTFTKKFTTRELTERIQYIEGDLVSGVWFLDEKGELTLNEEWVELEYKMMKTNRYAHKASAKYKFVSNTKDYFKLELSNGEYCCQWYNGSDPLIQFIQGNKSN